MTHLRLNILSEAIINDEADLNKIWYFSENLRRYIDDFSKTINLDDNKIKNSAHNFTNWSDYNEKNQHYFMKLDKTNKYHQYLYYDWTSSHNNPPLCDVIILYIITKLYDEYEYNYELIDFTLNKVRMFYEYSNFDDNAKKMRLLSSMLKNHNFDLPLMKEISKDLFEVIYIANKYSPISREFIYDSLCMALHIE